MREEEVNVGGVLAATLLALLATVGSFLTHDEMSASSAWLLLALFGAALLTLSGAVVNFDPRRLIK